MFGESLMSMQVVRRRGRWLTLPLSLVFHLFVVAAFIVGPLLTAQASLPAAKSIDLIRLVNPPQAPTVPAGGKPGARRTVKPQQEEQKAARPKLTGVLVVPPEPPAEIPDEDLTALSSGGTGPYIEGLENIEGGGGGPMPLIDGGDFDPQLTQQVIRVTKKPTLIKRVEPIYPELALRVRVQGVVVIEARTDAYGRVRDTRVISGQPLLNDAAETAVKQWLYEPYLVNGMPRPVVFVVTVTFSLSMSN